jgi:CHAD domain-containing protein
VGSAKFANGLYLHPAMSSNILEYYQKHKAIIEEQLPLCADPNDVEAIHNLRLGVKRIRVVAMLAELLSENTLHSKILLKPINKFFKRSGKLRDVQVTSQLLLSFSNSNLQPVINIFREREKKQRVKFETELGLFDTKCLDDFEHALNELLKNISVTKAYARGQMLLSELENDMHELFHSRTDEKRMHAIRTRIKNINYLNNIYNGQLLVQDHLGIDADRLRELGEMAGAWHDYLNLEMILNKFIIKNADIPKLSAIETFTEELSIRKQGLYQEYYCILLNEVKI